LVIVGLGLYLPLLTQNYDINGLAEAAAVQSGRAGDLWNPNHMLYRPVGYFVRQSLGAIGFALPSIPVLQFLSAIFGALGLGFTYLSLQRLTQNRTIAIWMSVALGVSWSYWTLSTDVYYFSLAAMLVAASLAAFVYSRQSDHSESTSLLVTCGFLAGLSILACQYNVVLIPALSAGAVLRDREIRLGKAIPRLMRIWIPLGAVVGVVYIATGISVYGLKSVSSLLNWGSNYTGNRLPMWGVWWPPSRAVQTLGSAFKSILGLDFWMYPRIVRHLPNGELPSWLAVLGFAVMAGLLFVAFRKGTGARSVGESRAALWLLILYSVYLPFVMWWESIEPRWFIVPNIFLAALVAVVLTRWANWSLFRFALPAGVLMLGVMNLGISAGPKHFKKAYPTQIAECVAGQMKDSDLFLATEWNWSDYLHYVHQREVVSFIGEVSAAGRDKNVAMEKIRQIVKDRHQRGLQVIMTDVASYPPEYMKWLFDQTGLTVDDLRTFKGEPAFRCVTTDFLRLD
jgi:hypothetical protein